MTTKTHENPAEPGKRTPDIELTDADFPPTERIEIRPEDLAPPPAPHDDVECTFAKVLGLKGRVTREDVRHAYREHASQYHPDKVQHLGKKLREVADNEMRAINEAYAYFRSRYNF